MENSPSLTQQLLDIELGARLRTVEHHHAYAINPFSFYTVAEGKFLVRCFVERVNSVFGLFRDGELESSLNSIGEITPSGSNQIMAELCLACALGSQLSNSEIVDKTIMWYENGRRYLDDVDWESKPWVMRAMVLISLYHIEERRETSSHYLGQCLFLQGTLVKLNWADIALNIGRNNHLDTARVDGRPQGQEASLWLPVWGSVTFINWYGSCPKIDRAQLT